MVFNHQSVIFTLVSLFLNILKEIIHLKILIKMVKKNFPNIKVNFLFEIFINGGFVCDNQITMFFVS